MTGCSCGGTLHRLSTRLFHCRQCGRRIMLPRHFDRTSTIEQALAMQVRVTDTQVQGTATASVGTLHTSRAEAPW